MNFFTGLQRNLVKLEIPYPSICNSLARRCDILFEVRKDKIYNKGTRGQILFEMGTYFVIF